MCDFNKFENSMKKEKIRVVVVDDHAIFRQGMKTLIDEIPDVIFAGEASNGQEFLDKLDELNPDVVFMDIKMPVKNGFETTRESLVRKPGMSIITLSMFGEEEYLEEMLEAGAKGFIQKNIQKDEIRNAIQNLSEGKSYFSAEMLEMLAHRFIKPQKREPAPEEILTSREIDVLKLVCEGYTNQEIGNLLFISQRTVDGHRSRLLEKTGAKNTVGLVVFAIRNKLVNLMTP